VKKQGTSGKSKDHFDVQEVGPRFEMKLYHLKLATIEMTDADTEWVLRPYMNTAKKRKTL
jgi:U3 small nucleolar ribonucleoprotein protein IMP4